jgi:hypothetical protein
MVSPEDRSSDIEGRTSSDALHEGFKDYTDSGNTTGDWERCAWTLCAAVSFVTSKYVLVDYNFHYPLHLVTIQVVATGAIALFGRAAGFENIISTMIVKENRPWQFIAMVNCLDALAMAFWTQTILHFPNLATLGMLPVSISPIPTSIHVNKGSRFWWH